MALRDHFQAPLFPRHPWESFLTVWAVAITGRLNGALTGRYLATVIGRFGRQVQNDVAADELPESTG